MKLKTLGLATGLALASTTASATPWINIDARAGGMGGLSIVTSNIDAAPFTNPAMLAAGQEDDDFGMLVTGGAFIGDPNNFSGALTDFNTAFNAIPPNPLDPGFVAAVDSANTALGNLGGKGYIADIGGGVASSFKWGQWAAAVSAGVTSANDFGVGSSDSNPPSISYVDGSTNATLEAISINIQDVGLSLARNFELGEDWDLAVGVTPKMQTITVGEGSQALNLADPTNITGLNINLDTSGSSFNTDVGVVARYNKDFKAGLVIRNLLAQSFTTTAGTKVDIQPVMRAGVAYNQRLFTVGVDLDLTENTAYVSGAKSKYMIIGAEVNAWDIAQLRAGYRTNTLNSDDKQISAGVGLFNAINVGVMYNPSNTSAGASAYMSFGFKF